MRKYLDILVINLCSLGIGLGFYYLSGKHIEVLGAVIATGISLSLGIRQYKTENDKIFNELFLEFNTKYDTKFNEILDDIVINCETLSPDQEKIVVDYINFCAEEYLWKTKDRIPSEVWKSWENGMVYYLNNPLINGIVVKEKGQSDSYYGLFAQLNNRVDNLD